MLLIRVGESGVPCHLDSSTDTTGHDVVGGSRVLCHLDSLMVTLD